jgi:hypothetical protein
VAVPGVATWKQGWVERFDRFDRVYVCFDCDEKGREAAAIRVGQLGKVTTAMPVDLDPDRDDGYDVNDLLLEKGAGAASALSSLATVTSGAVTPFQPRIDSDPPYDRLKRALEGAGCRVAESGHGKASSTCPNHEDRHPSLSLSEGDGGKALIHCHAGCQPEEVVRALGLTLHDLFQKAV